MMRATDRLTLLFSIWILLGAAAGPVWAADVSATDTSGLPGATITFQVQVKTGTGETSTAGDLTVNLNQAKVKVANGTKITAGANWPSALSLFTNVKGNDLRIIFINLGGTAVAIDGSINVEATIDANASGTVPATLTKTELLDANSNLLSVNRRDGTITVLASPAEPPLITKDPADQTVTKGATATFSVTATGTAPLSYQWQKNQADIAGATSSSYTTPATTLADNNTKYRCVVTNSAGSATSNKAKLPVTPPANGAPTADAQSVSTNEDTAKAITLTGSDPNGDALTYSIVDQPAKGSLSGTAPNVTYTPSANYNGSDSFTFMANDGKLDSATATVSITVTAVNDAPVADSQSVTTEQNTAKNITLTGSDVDGDTLTYHIMDQPAKGSLSGTAPNVTYTPNANYNGSDSFTFMANDGKVDSNAATVSITVNAPKPPGNATVKVTDASAKSGEEATYSVEIDTQSQLAGGYQITVVSQGVEIDKKTVTLTKGPATPAGIFMGNALPKGEIRAVWADTTGGGFSIDKSKGSAFDVKFTVPAGTPEGTYKLELTLADILKPDGKSFSVSRTSGTLTVTAGSGEGPTVTKQPANQTVTVGETATFSVTAKGTAPLSYQWQVSTPPDLTFRPINGATSAGYSFTAALDQDGNQYRVKVSNSIGEGTSDSAKLTVKPASAQKITITATATPTSGQAPLTVNFAAAASSQDENGNPVRIVLNEWDVKGWGHYAWNSSTTGNMGDYTYTAGGTYLATVRATDARGAQGTYSIPIEVTPHPDAPNAALSSNTVEGQAPLEVLFTTQASSVNRIAYIVYDFDGNGRGDYVDDLKSPSKPRDRRQSKVTHLYTEPGLYAALVEVVDNKGLSALRQLPIHVLENPSAPQVTLSVDKTEGVAPLKVTLTPNISPTGGPIQMAWDFGDGESQVSTKGEPVTHTYSHPGVFKPEVCVRNAKSLSTCAHSRVTVADDGNLAHPDARFKAKPPSGNAPLEVTLNRTDKKKVDQLRWTIDGKLHRLFRKGKPENTATALFRDVGMHLVQLKTLDKNGVAAWESLWIPVGDGKPKVMILGPKAGAVLGKGVIPIIAAVDSRLENVKVDFQIAAGEDDEKGREQDWMSIGVVTQPPYVFLWDTSQKGKDGKPLYEDGKYALRVVVNDATYGILGSPVQPVKIDENDLEPDLKEETAREKERSRWKAKAVTEEAREVMLGDQTAVEVPVDLVQADQGRLTIVALDPSRVPVVLSTSDPNVAAAGVYYQIDLVNLDPQQKDEQIHELDQPLSIRMPYKEENGKVKGTQIPQETLSLYRYDESTQSWVPLPSTVNVQIGTVEATTPHLSLFGLGGIFGGGGGGGGGDGGGGGGAVGAIGGALSAVGGGGGGGKKCFIATAAFGTPMAPEVNTLRAYRDHVLAKSAAGRIFVENYYRYSPPVARFIKDKPALRWLVRQLLKPLIRYAKKAV